MNLIKLGLNIEPLCNLWKKENKFTLHGLVTCPAVRKVWYASPLSLRITQHENEMTSFQGWIVKLLTMSCTRIKDKTWLCEYIVIICW